MQFEGKVLSAFKLSEKLGQGAMGLVYKAVHEETGQIGAIKFIDAGSVHCLEGSEGSGLQTLVNRFSDEAKAVTAIENSYIVNTLAIGDDIDLGKYIVMEFLPGLTLEDTLKKGPLPLDPFMEELAIPLLSGLSAMHKAGILHRDIKPANLIASASGGYKISDFGLAVFKGRVAKTKTGFIIGTAGYLAPELFMGTVNSLIESCPCHASVASLPFHSDLYSAGIVLTEALCGSHPFRTPNLAETVKRQTSYVPSGVSICELGRRNGVKVPITIGKVLARSLSSSPGDRFHGCDEFLQALEEATKSNLPSEGYENPTVPMKASVRSRSFKPLISLFLCLLVIFGIWWASSSDGLSSQVYDETGIVSLDPEVKLLLKDFFVASADLSAELIVPSSRSLEQFFVTGQNLYRSIGDSSFLSPQDKIGLWKMATSKLSSNEKSLARYISSCHGERREAFKYAELTLYGYRSSFSEAFPGGDEIAVSQLGTYLDSELWLLRKILYSASFCKSDADYAKFSLDLILNGELFVHNLLVVAFKVKSSISGQAEKIPLKQMKANFLSQEAAKYRVTLFLWRATVFAFRVPVGPYDSFLTSQQTGISEDEFVTAVDSSLSIVKGVEFLLNKLDIDAGNKAELINYAELVNGFTSKDKKCQDALSFTSQLLSEAKGADKSFLPLTMNRFFSEQNILESIDKGGDYLRKIYGETCGDGQVIMAVLKNRDVTLNQTRFRGAMVLGRRIFWNFYPLLLLNNSMISSNRNSHVLPLRFLSFMSIYVSYAGRIKPIDLLVKNSWTGIEVNAGFLADVTAIIASVPLINCSSEMLSPSIDGSYTPEALTFNFDYISGLLPVSNRLTALADDRDPKFENVMIQFFERWDSLLAPLMDKGSFSYCFLQSRRLLAKENGKIRNEVVSSNVNLAIELGTQVFEGASIRIRNNLDKDLGFCRDTILLNNVSQFRWPALRRYGRLKLLLSEALWVQKTLLKFVDNGVADDVESLERGRLFANATANIGHVYLVQDKAELLSQQRPYLQLSKSLIRDLSSSLMANVTLVLEGNKIP